MRQRREVDRKALERLNGDIGVWFDGQQPLSPANLPSSHTFYVARMSSILSCSTYGRGGERMIRFGIPTSPDTVMYIDYDETAARNWVLSFPGGAEEWDPVYSFKTLLARVAGGERAGVSFGVFFDVSNYQWPRPD
jgi:hypothetical protein